MNTDEDDHDPLSAEQAFSVLGNETRLAILRALADADGTLSFTELRSRVGLRQGTQFNYHLTKLVGHFVEKHKAGYSLREPGRRVVQAVLAGAVEDGPWLPPTSIEYDCHFCGAAIEVRYLDGWFSMHCPTCFEARSASTTADEYGNLASMPFPPAGMEGRSPLAALRAAATWIHLDAVAVSSGVCPRCSAPVECTVNACVEHDVTPETDCCPRCEKHHAIRPYFECTNCVFEFDGPVVMGLLATPELLAFVGEHGLNVTSMGVDWGWEYKEEVVATDPFEARLVFTIDGDSLTLVVDGQLNAERRD
jgi:DNA-binding transcriptional ArsR family regulator